MTGFRINDRTPQVLATIEAAQLRAVGLAAEHLLEQANRTVPHDEGDLEGSGATTDPAFDQPGRAVSAVYYDQPYAVRQHEDLTLSHPDGRRARWLELTAQEQADTLRQIARGELGGGTF